MIRRLALVAMTAVVAGCQPAPTPTAEPPQQQPPASRPQITAGCDVEIVFGSYGAGIDGSMAEQVNTLLAADAGVSGVERTPWGREGEYNLCVHANDAAADRVYRSVSALIPDSSTRAPTSVAHRDGRSRAAGYPQ